MKRTMMAAAMLLLSFGAAEAACSKANMNGTWFVYLGPSGAQFAMSGGVIDMGGGSFLRVKSMGKNCVGIGEYESGGTILPAVVTVDRVPNASSAKPNQATFAVNFGGIFQAFRLVRK